MSIFVFISIDIKFAFAITTSLLIILLFIDSGYVSFDEYNKNIIIKNISGKTILSSIDPYEYWWNYDFDAGKIVPDQVNIKRKWESRSNKVIVNLVLKNEIHRIRFKETIILDTRHPNDAIYLEDYNSENTRTICVQRIDKLMLFLQDNLDSKTFVMDNNYTK